MKMRGNRTLWALLLSLGIGATGGITQAVAKPDVGCLPEISSNTVWRIVHDPHGAANNTFPFELQISNRGDLDCNGRIRVKTDNNIARLDNAETGQSLPYELQDARTGFDVTPPEFSDRPLAATLRVRPNQLAVNGYVVNVQPNGDPGAGEFTQNVTFEYLPPNSKTVLASRTIQIIYEVKASVRIGLKGEYSSSGGMRTINLGELEDRNYSPRTIVTVDSTRGYQLSIRSENLGRLVNEDPEWSIPYRLRLGDVAVDLSGVYQHTRISRRAVQDEYPLNFTVENTANRRAGRYRDVLHFTVAPL